MPNKSKARRWPTRRSKAASYPLPPVPEDLAVTSWRENNPSSHSNATGANVVWDTGSRDGSGGGGSGRIGGSAGRGGSGSGSGGGGSGGGSGSGGGDRGTAAEALGGGQQQQQQLPAPAPGCLPGASLTAAHLCGAAASEVGLPPRQQGELRVCGLTFHPDLAPRVRQQMAAWQQGLGHIRLEDADPDTCQVQVMLSGVLPGFDAGVIPYGLSHHLGLGGSWAMRLPEDAPELVGVEACQDASARGGWVLRANCAIKKASVVGVVGGYVMPRAVGSRFARSSACWDPAGLVSQEATAELQRRCGGHAPHAWKFITRWYGMPYPAAHTTAEASGGQGGAAAGGDDGMAGAVVTQLGYGNLAALVADPRVFEEQRNAADGGAQAQGHGPGREANCVVVPVSVRGLVLPVLVALRDISQGDLLLCDRGEAWWEEGEVRLLSALMDRRKIDCAVLLHGKAC